MFEGISSRNNEIDLQGRALEREPARVNGNKASNTP